MCTSLVLFLLTSLVVAIFSICLLLSNSTSPLCIVAILFNKFILWLFLEKKLPCFRSYSPRDRSPRRRSYSRSPPPRARSLSRSPPPARARSLSRTPPPPPPRNNSRSPPATRVLSRSPPPPPARSRSRSYSRSPGQQPQRDESPYGNDA